MKDIKFDEKGLIPAIVQDYVSGEVLMLAYMNAESLKQTMETGKATYWSRSRNALWVKGETSGHFQLVKELCVDCDQDTLLLKVEQVDGVACHTGNRSCFYRSLDGEGIKEVEKDDVFALAAAMQEDYLTLCDRKSNPKEGSYTTYLFKEGVDKILKKVGEETSEIIIAAKNDDLGELNYEIADLMYHLTVLMVERGVSWEQVFAQMRERQGKKTKYVEKLEKKAAKDNG